VEASRRSLALPTKILQQNDWDHCAADPVYWINAHVKTYDPRTPSKTLPFKLFPRQEAFLRWLQTLERKCIGGLCEKSRDAGVSYLCAAYALHGWLFRPGYKAGFGSRKLMYVDQLGNMDSVFEKIRFMLRSLPEYLRPKGFVSHKHDCNSKILNPDNGASITGEGGDNIGRGGRCSIYFVDEAAFLEHPQKVDAALIANTDVRVDVSTPNGLGNPFYSKRFQLPAEQIFTLHWRDDPRKGEEWAERTRREKGPVVFAAEYDIDYSASLEGIAIPNAWVRTAIGLRLPESNQCIAGLDVGAEGNDLSVFLPRRGAVILPPQSWGKLHTTATAYRAKELATLYQVHTVYYDSVGIGAGVKGTWQSSEKVLPFRTRPINAGSTPTESVWPDGQTSREKFLNLKAELWWAVRRRFERTYEFVAQGIQHPPDELISLPDHPQLIAELSLPLYELTETGKIRMEAKASLARRGVKSPDFAEALILSEAHYAARKQQLWIHV